MLTALLGRVGARRESRWMDEGRVHSRCGLYAPLLRSPGHIPAEFSSSLPGMSALGCILGPSLLPPLVPCHLPCASPTQHPHIPIMSCPFDGSPSPSCWPLNPFAGHRSVSRSGFCLHCPSPSSHWPALWKLMLLGYND